MVMINDDRICPVHSIGFSPFRFLQTLSGLAATREQSLPRRRFHEWALPEEYDSVCRRKSKQTNKSKKGSMRKTPFVQSRARYRNWRVRPRGEDKIAMSVIRVDRVPLGIESRAPTVPQRSVQTCSPVSRAHDERKANRRIQAITDSGQCFRIAGHIAL
jgi:hypothetical protein